MGNSGAKHLAELLNLRRTGFISFEAMHERQIDAGKNFLDLLDQFTGVLLDNLLSGFLGVVK